MSIIFHPPGEVHADYFDEEPGRCLSIEFAPHWLERLCERPSILDESTDFQESILSRYVSQLYKEFRAPDPFSSLAIEGLALELLAQASRWQIRLARTPMPGWLKKAQDLLHERCTANLALADIAHMVEVHPVYFTRGFRKYFGCTPSEYLRHLRTAHACKLIAHSDLPLVQIALQVGFADQSHFTRTFKRVMGVTPAAFRETIRPS